MLNLGWGRIEINGIPKRLIAIFGCSGGGGITETSRHPFWDSVWMLFWLLVWKVSAPMLTVLYSYIDSPLMLYLVSIANVGMSVLRGTCKYNQFSC